MTITQQVENILKYVPSTRSSDKELWLIYVQKAGLNLTPAQIDKIKGMPSFETLRRVRQKIQEGGNYPATEVVKKKRKFKAMQMQQQAPSFKPDGLERTLTGQIIMPWGK